MESGASLSPFETTRSPRPGLTLMQWGLFFTAAFIAFTGAKMLHGAASIAVDDLTAMVGGACWVIAGIMGWLVLMQRPLAIKVTVLALMISFLLVGWVLQLVVTDFAALTLGLGALFVLILTVSLRTVYRINYKERTAAAWNHQEGHIGSVSGFRTQDNKEVSQSSNESPVLLVFLPQLGGAFCAKTLKKIKEVRPTLEKNNVQLFFVYKGSHAEADPVFSKHRLNENIERVADPDAAFYAHMGLKQGHFFQLYGLEAFVEGIAAGIFQGHGISLAQIKAKQLSGVFLITKGQIKRAFRPKVSADLPDFLYAADCMPSVGIEETEGQERT